MLLKIIAQPVLHVIVGVVSVIVVSDMSGDDMTDLLLSISGAIGTVALILSISARLQFNKVRCSPYCSNLNHAGSEVSSCIKCLISSMESALFSQLSTS